MWRLDTRCPICRASACAAVAAERSENRNMTEYLRRKKEEKVEKQGNTTIVDVECKRREVGSCSVVDGKGRVPLPVTDRGAVGKWKVVVERER